MILKRTLSAALLGAVVLSSLPWEAAALGPLDGSPVGGATVPAPTSAGGESTDFPEDEHFPTDECACLCGLCAVAAHAVVHQTWSTPGAPGAPAREYSPAPDDAHAPSLPTGLFRPPKSG